MEDGSAGLMQLKPMTFRYKQEPDLKQYGLIAEQVAHSRRPRFGPRQLPAANFPAPFRISILGMPTRAKPPASGVLVADTPPLFENGTTDGCEGERWRCYHGDAWAISRTC
jgi:hypothetical protein